MKIEIHFNHFHPFKWAWICYLLGAIFLAFFYFGQRPAFYKVSWFFLLIAAGLHAYGMGIRCYLTGRPPVSNIYETVIWVPFGTVVLAMILEVIYKSRLLLLACSTVAILCLILADAGSAILDSSLQPLEPVLRSTFWLSTHVVS